VLTVIHATTKKTILYPVLFPIPPDIVNFRADGPVKAEAMDVEGAESDKDQDVRALWAKVKIGDYTQLRYDSIPFCDRSQAGTVSETADTNCRNWTSTCCQRNSGGT
jgi:hypothetical protein